MRSLSIAATGMLAQQLNVEVISNNIANMNTTGHKRQRAEFADLLYQNLRRMGASSSDANTIVPSGIQIGTGVKPGAVYRIHEQGNMQLTSNSYDLAINGKGFFAVTLPSGQDAYTRAGAFQLSAQGQLVSPDGYTPFRRTRCQSASTRPARSRSSSRARRPHRRSASSPCRPSSTKRVWKALATICSSRRHRPARRPPVPRAPPASARYARAMWKPRTSTRCRKSPT